MENSIFEFLYHKTYTFFSPFFLTFLFSYEESYKNSAENSWGPLIQVPPNLTFSTAGS